MNGAKQLLLATYYYGTLPARRLLAQRRAGGSAPVMVLFYHRIADTHPNDWTMKRKTFANQIHWLKENFDLVSMAEAQRRIAQGNCRPAVCITFDDGYAENCDFALPLLIRERIPVTYFVALRQVTEGIPFPHDERSGCCLPVNTPSQIRDIAGAGVEIGAHTRTHPDLGKVTSADQLFDEIVTARDELQSLVGQSIRYFAFPFGKPANMSQAACRLIEEAGFAGFCSAYGGYNFPGDDPYHLERMHGDTATLRLKNNLSVDPRKLFCRKRFVYHRASDLAALEETVP